MGENEKEVPQNSEAQEPPLEKGALEKALAAMQTLKEENERMNRETEQLRRALLGLHERYRSLQERYADLQIVFAEMHRGIDQMAQIARNSEEQKFSPVHINPFHHQD